MTTRQPSFTREELLACSEGKLFGPGNSQLPAPNMLMMDRIVEISETGGEFGKGFIHAELDISPDLWFFDCPESSSAGWEFISVPTAARKALAERNAG